MSRCKKTISVPCSSTEEATSPDERAIDEETVIAGPTAFPLIKKLKVSPVASTEIAFLLPILCWLCRISVPKNER